jgi:3-oxoacyl-[acyl-carrier protein] reductase
MDLGLRGKVAAIAGGGEGIGRALAFRLAEEGARVAICARREELVQTAAQEVAAATGGEVLAIGADVAHAADCLRFIQSVIERFGRLDILINDVGGSSALPFEQATDEVWRDDIEGTLMGAIRCARLALPYMRRQGGGRIIHMTAIGGKLAGGHWAPASATWAAGIHFAQALATEYAADNILVNTICLGRIKGALCMRHWQAHDAHLTLDEYYAKEGETIPLRRLGEAEDVADLVCFLASERARYITGTAINIDGGLSGAV